MINVKDFINPARFSSRLKSYIIYNGSKSKNEFQPGIHYFLVERSGPKPPAHLETQQKQSWITILAH